MPPFNSGALREQLMDLRRTVLSGFDSQGDRLLADMRSVLQELHPRTALPPARRAGASLAAVGAGGGAGRRFVVLVGLLWHQSSRLSSVRGRNWRAEGVPARGHRGA